MNHLVHLDEFRNVLSGYKVSPSSQKILENTKLVLLCAPSGVGRNTIIRELLKTDEYHFIVSDTTRKPRINDGVAEQTGVEYWFRSEQEVLADLKSGKFLEAAIIHNQQVSGISIRELELATRQHRAAVSDIEIVGVHNIISAKPETIAIFVLPPSFDEWMRRLTGRGHMSKEELNRRLESASKELKAALEHDYYKFVVNDNFHHAAQQIHQIVIEGSVDNIAQETAKKLAQKLYDETHNFLQENQ